MRAVNPPFIETLRNLVDIHKLGLELVRSAKQEIQMLLLPTNSNELLKEEHAQIILLKEIVMRHQVSVRILTSEYVHKRLEKLIEEQEVIKHEQQQEEEEKEIKEDSELVTAAQRKVQIHLVDMLHPQEQQRLQTNISILIVDSKLCLVGDLNAYNSSNGAQSLATYSNSESTVLTYISIFETLWAQTELRTQKM